MNKADGQDTADRLSTIVANSLDTQAKTQDLARQAYQYARSSRKPISHLIEPSLDGTYHRQRNRGNDAVSPPFYDELITTGSCSLLAQNALGKRNASGPFHFWQVSLTIAKPVTVM